ncbi:MAG: hypothetical protein V3W05_07430, partial [candidate division NC10 bacterium]
VGHGPTHVGINAESGVVYVLNTEDDSVTVLDGRQMRRLSTIPVGNYPIGIAVDEKADRAYIVNNRGNTLSIIDEATLEVRGTTQIAPNVSNLDLNSPAGLLYLALKSENRVALVRVRDL